MESEQALQLLLGAIRTREDEERAIEAVGFKVLKLVRTGIGPLTLEGLEVGSWRELTRPELAALRQSRVRPRRGSPIAV